jgi:hypothetical protein
MAVDSVLPNDTSKTDHDGMADSDVSLPDRRRPGRQRVSQALIPLLRRPAGDGGVDARSVSVPRAVSDNRSSPFKGIIIAAAIAVPAWAGIGWVIALIRR